MKMLYLALCIFPQLCLAVDQGQLNAMLLIAGKAQSNQYIEARQKILSLGANNWGAVSVGYSIVEK